MLIKLDFLFSILCVQIAKIRSQSFNVRKQCLLKAVNHCYMHYFCFSDVFLTNMFVLNENVKEKLSVLFKNMTSFERYMIYVMF